MTRARTVLVSCTAAFGVAVLLGASADARPGGAQRAHAPVEAEGRRIQGVAAGDSVGCTVRAILGNQSAGGVDKRLKVLKKQLSKPPFSAYKQLRLLDSKQMTIGQGAVQKSMLPTGKLLKLRFKEKLLVKGKVRLRMHLSITPPKAKEFLPGTLFTIADGGTLLVAGDSHQGGTLVVGITCQSK